MSRVSPSEELLDELERIFEEEAVGKENSLTSGEIASRAGISDSAANPNTRGVIRVLVEEREIPVAAGPSGYWRLQSVEEFYSYQQRLAGRVRGIEERRELVAEAWGGFGGEQSV